MNRKLTTYVVGFSIAILAIGCGGTGGGGTTGGTNGTGSTTGGIPLNTILYKVLLTNGDEQIRYAKPDGSGSSVLRTVGSQYYASTPNPTQSAWAFGFNSNPNGNAELDLFVGASGNINGAERLTFLDFSDISAIAWSSDESLIAFIGLDGLLGWGLYVVDLINGDVTRLDDGAGSVEFSPDGQTIVYEKDLDDGFGFDSEICSILYDGTGFRQLTDNDWEDFDPAWSHDGKRIIFASQIDIFSDIFMMNADGSNQRNLSNSQIVQETGPSFSPNDSQIGFAADFDNGDDRNGIYKMNANGTGRVVVLASQGIVKTYWWP